MATLELLMEGVSVDSLSMEAVAARAGVGKATLYRRWPNKEAVLIDALASLSEPPARIVGKSVRHDLITLVDDLCRWIMESTPGKLLPRLLGTPALYAQYCRLVIEPRLAMIREVLRRGVRTREIMSGSDLELLLRMLFGSVLSRLLLVEDRNIAADDSGGRAELAERIVDQVLFGITPNSGS